MKLEVKGFEGSRSSVIIETKYGATIHTQTNDRIQFSTSILSIQNPQINSSRPLSKNGQTRNTQTR